MPTTLVGQNGAQITQNTKIEVEGCASTLAISSHKIKNRTLTLTVILPSAGKLTGSGKGLKSASRSSAGRETLTLKLTQRKAGKLHTKITLHFTPSKGSKLSKSLSVTFKH